METTTSNENATVATVATVVATGALADLAAAMKTAQNERSNILAEIADIDQQRAALTSRLNEIDTALGIRSGNGGSGRARGRRGNSQTSEAAARILTKMQTFPADTIFAYKDLEAFSELTHDNAHGMRYHAIMSLRQDAKIVQIGRSQYKVA